MNSSPLPTSFEPEYGPVVTRVWPGIVVLLGLCGGFFLLGSGPPAFWLALLSFGVAAGFVGLYLWYLVYREVVFGEDAVVVRRYLFPDVRGAYDEVDAVGSTGFRLGGYPVSWHTMKNDGEARRIVGDLVAQGRISAAEDGGLTRDMELNRSAVTRATILGIVLWLGAELLGLVPSSIPNSLSAVGMVVLAVVIGAPVIKHLSTR